MQLRNLDIFPWGFLPRPAPPCPPLNDALLCSGPITHPTLSSHLAVLPYWCATFQITSPHSCLLNRLGDLLLPESHNRSWRQREAGQRSLAAEQAAGSGTGQEHRPSEGRSLTVTSRGDQLTWKAFHPAHRHVPCARPPPHLTWACQPPPSLRASGSRCTGKVYGKEHLRGLSPLGQTLGSSWWKTHLAGGTEVRVKGV